MKKLLSKTHRRFRNLSWLHFFPLVGVFLATCIGAYFVIPAFTQFSYEAASPLVAAASTVHIPTPEPLKAIYMTQCVVGTPTFRAKLVSLIDETEINAVIIDIKDYSGKLSFTPEDSTLKESVSNSCGARDMKDFVKMLHEKGIYVMGRITVFQDPHYTKLHPELAVKRKSDHEATWHDYKGLAFIDVGARPYWDYIIRISRASYELGFDELNFDYIRFPSDGDMSDTYFSWSLGRPKAEALKEFFAYLSESLRNSGAVISADLFGMTTTNSDDLNIGQVLENALPYFDYVFPMVYPSHYPTNFRGFKNPAEHPYEVVYFSMSEAVRRAKEASTTPFFRGGMVHPLQLRPWLQDFDLGAIYTPELIRAQMQATYDAGLTSWALWDASNTYTKGALLPE